MFQDIFHVFFSNQIAVAFLIIALGYAIGRLEFKGVTVGSSGVLLIALLFGHFGYTVSSAITDLGIILFVYMIGLQAGPRFFHTFKKRGLAFAQLAVLIVAAGMAASVGVSIIFGISPDLTAGIFAGAMTSTPALAAAIETSKSTLGSIGYGIAYPFGVLGVIIFVQILPKIIKVDVRGIAHDMERESDEDSEKIVRSVLVVQNPSMDGKQIKALHLHKYSHANITRIQRQNKVLPVKPDSLLYMGDHISVVGLSSEIETLKLILGEETEEANIFASQEVISRDVFIADNAFAGKTISQLQISTRYGIVVTRIRRDEMEFTPTGNFVLEIGDSARIVGDREDCERFIKDAGQHEKHIQETNILNFTSGIVLGSILGFTPIELPGGITLRLGLAGGPLFVALLFSHFGRIGRFNVRVPYGAKYILRELGLLFFLVGAGTQAGGSILSVLREHGIVLFGAGIIITSATLVIAYLASVYLFKFDILTLLGAVSGGMTSTPGLGVVMNAVDSEVPAVAYTSIYPIALIITTIAAQVLVMIL